MQNLLEDIQNQKRPLKTLRINTSEARPVLLKRTWPGNPELRFPAQQGNGQSLSSQKSEGQKLSPDARILEGAKLSPDVCIREGTQAPNFALPDSEGRIIKLSDFRGKKVVLYFYNRNMTPSDSMEACGFRDFHGYFRDKGIIVLGVSIDSEKSHRKFKNWFGLPYTLLSDEYGRVARMYGLFQKKNQNGREFWSVKRATFAIGPDGEILKTWDKVDVNYHHQEVLRFFDGEARKDSKTARNF